MKTKNIVENCLVLHFTQSGPWLPNFNCCFGGDFILQLWWQNLYHNFCLHYLRYSQTGNHDTFCCQPFLIDEGSRRGSNHFHVTFIFHQCMMRCCTVDFNIPMKLVFQINVYFEKLITCEFWYEYILEVHI